MTTEAKKVLVIGSGPIIIGQAAEFDYAGTQACRSLREEGYKVVLVNSNPATIMTDTDIADRVYVEPISLEFVTEVIKKERPWGLLATLGGQVGLNMAVQLSEAGVLEEYGVKLLGTTLEAIKHAEDRELFKEAMKEINQPVPESDIFNDLEEAVAFANRIGYPIIIRPAYTLGGTGGGIAHNEDEMYEITRRGLKLSPIHQILAERSVAGWKEIEYEVMRDSADNCIIVCNMENIDPVGVHTGDSIVVAPSQTLNDIQYQMLRTASVEIDGVNINGLSFNELRKVRKRIGMVFQQFNLLNAKSVYDNVAIPLILNKVPKSDIDKKVKTLLDFVDLGDKANAYPGELSGGQKQRVGIARALATDPSILLCDEATSALDPDTTESILQLLERVNRELGVTVVIVTHEIDVIQKICNRVVVMEHGKLIESGSVLEVFSKPKHETTKRFVRTVIPDEIPSTVKHTLACDKRPYTILKMHFLGNNTTDNVLYHINKTFDLETSVLFATVTELEHTVLGIFIVQFIGDDLEVGKVKEYLVAQGIEWQEVTL